VLKSVFFAILAFVFIGCGGSNSIQNQVNGIISSEYNIGEANITKEGKIKDDIEVKLLSEDKKSVLVVKVPKDTKLIDENGDIVKNPKIRLIKKDSGENQVKIEDENGNKVIPTKPLEVKIKAPEDAKEGDSVKVDIPETQKEKESNYFNKVKSFIVGKKGFIPIKISPAIFKKFDIITIKVIGKEKKSDNNEDNSTQTSNRELNTTSNNEENQTEAQEQTQRRNQEQNTTSSTTHEQSQRRNQEQNVTSSTTHEQSQRRNQEQNATSSTNHEQTQRRSQEQNTTSSTNHEQTQRRSQEQNATSSTNHEQTQRRNQEEDTTSTSEDSSQEESEPVADTTLPIITLKGDNPLILEYGDTYKEAGFSAIDDTDGNITSNVIITQDINSSKEGTYKVIYEVADSSGNKAKKIREVKIVDPYPYIPKDKNLTYDTTFRFLQKTTFGPTQELIDEVEKKGIVPWLEEQLNQTYELNDSLTYQTLKMGQTINPFAYNHDISEYMAEDTTLHLPPWGSDHIKVRDYFISSWAKDVFFGKKQVQMRVAYALSQIIVASNSAGVFHGKYQGLAAYYDLMKKHALGNYGELLKEVSTNPAMGYYLTFYGNQKKHLNSRGEWVYPDENYAREVMQLFSISPFLLNMDGTKVLDNNGEPVPSYTQDDVNELARVFTGLDFRLAKNFGNTGTRGGDLIHKMECHDNYHDTDEKTLLGKTIPEGGDCYNDVDKAIDILMSHQNTAPFIAKKLIMRLAKSNPSPEYVQRVAQVFENNGKGEKGDIKATVRAVYFDKEFWDDIVNKRSMKYKEPLIAFTQMARTFHVKPYPKWHLKISSSDTKEIRDKKVVLEDTGLIWIDSLLGDIFGEGPTQSKTVFNFYSDDYVPSDDYFLKNNYVAPEIQIQTDGAFVAYHNYIYDVTLNEKNYALNKHGVNLYNPYKFKVYTDMKEFGNDLDMVFHKDKFYFDLTPYYKLVEDTLREEVDGKDLEEILDKAHEEQYLFSLELRKKAISKVVDLLDKELTGNSLNDEFKRILVDKYAIKLRYWDSRDQRLFYMLVLKMLVQMVVIYDDYKVE